ncbi:unnamed protein product [Paramecium pentaurelia]|uniref:RING-type domain-containing protein n=1 Tax=Paramecium pentaurelia TaxID=43138 RepID=A0A8S1T7U5_9CILI|nr:unnamed protein product [Paramecium pentaurelia]
MLLLIIICLIETCLTQKKDKQYIEVTGLQNFEIKDFIPKNLSEKQKVTFTLTYEDGEIPIFVICDNQPHFNTLTNYESIQNQNCLSDINAYDQKSEIQSISLTKNVKSQAFQKHFNIYQIDNQNMFVGAYSKKQSTFLMTAIIQSLYNCGKECKNGGSCFYGICECQEGTFGDDCSIIGIDIKDQLKLSPNKLYYLSLYSTGATFQRILSNQIPLKQQCYAEKPFIDQGSILITNLLQLNYDQIQNCRNLTKTLQDEIKIKQNAYITFKIYSQYDVNILINSDQDDGLSKMMMIIFIPLCIVFFFLLVCCCVKIYQKKLPQTQIHKKVDQDFEASFVNLYMPTLKFQQVKEIIQDDINQQETYCSICLEKFTLQNNVKVTYCKHIYHSQCLSIWIKKIKICPLCRAPLDEKTLAQLMPLRSQTLIDQISSKSQSNNNKLKILSLNSLSSLNGANTQNAFQHLNYQRSLVLVE